MSIVSEAKAVLEADITLAALATGGIWDFDETGRLGLSRTTTPDAYDEFGIIKPTILLKQRSDTPDYALADDNTQYVSSRVMLEVWLYEDTGYSNIEAMRDRVYTLLAMKQLPNSFQTYPADDIRPGMRDVDADANVERSDYSVQTSKSA